MWEFLALYLLVGLVAAATTIAGDLRHHRLKLDDLDAESLALLFMLRALSWPLGLIYYRKK